MDITITNLTKVYNKHTVVNIPELAINKGELIGLIGNNGAGKTTLFRLLLDLIKAETGKVCSRGQDVSTSQVWKQYSAAYIDTGFLIEFLTPEEYFDFIATNYGISSGQLQVTLSEFAEFMSGEILGKQKYIRNFSAGNQQKIGIIGAIISQPEILILDEPFNFLDPSSQSFISNYLRSLNNQQATTIILSSHNLSCILNIASRIVLLENGQIIKDQANSSDMEAELNLYFKLGASL